MADNFEKIKELKQMLDEGSITQEEFSQMKANLLSENSNPTEDSEPSRSFRLDKGKERKGVGWPEVLSVLFGIIGGLAYLFTKQPIVKKIVILVLSFLANGVYASLSTQTVTTNSQESQVEESGDSQRTTGSSQRSQAEKELTPATTTVSIGTFADVRDDRSLRVNKSETLESIKPNNSFADSVESKGGKLVAVT